MTGLRRVAPGRVSLEVDGRPWRVVPDDAVVHCGLGPGVRLDRPLLRALRRELRNAEALTVAARALGRRDLSVRQIEERMRRGGALAPERAEALRILAQAGALDDARVARRRAETLAERGWGDTAIRARLAGQGIGEDVLVDALAALEPEADRAERVTAGAADARKAVALLARRGFDEEVVGRALARLDADN